MRAPIKGLIKLVFIASAFLGLSAEAFDCPKRTHNDKGLVYIPSGFYKPFWKVEGSLVKMKSFFIREKCVTNQEFLEFVKANPEWRRSRIKRIFADSYYLINWENDTTLSSGAMKPVDPSAPVTFVSWFAARAFCRWKGVELPSFNEIEYAIEKLGKRALVRHQDALSSLHEDDKRWEWVEDINSFGAVLQRPDIQTDASIPLCAGAAVGFNNISDYEEFKRFSYLSSIKPNYCEPNLSFRWIIRISR